MKSCRGKSLRMSIASKSRWRLGLAESLAFLRRAWVRRAMLAIAALAIAAFLFRDAIFGAPADIHEAVRGDIVQTVVASGRVMTPLRVSVGAVITERVVRIPVDEGQSVHSGDVLIVLDDRDERAAVAQAQAAVEQAEAKLRQLREVGLPAAEQAVAQADANLRLARQQYARNQELTAKGFISQSALDDARRNLDVAESQLKTARLQVESNAPSGSDYLMARTALAQAQANLGAANAKLEQTVIRAPVEGTLIARNVEAGDVVQPGKELMVLAPAGETQIIVQIDEKNLAQLRLGQEALASADAYPLERFGAELFYINPGIDALRGSVEVKLRVPKPPSYLRQDMTVSVDVVVARHAGALVIPSEAVRDATGAHPWVLAVERGRAVRRPVKLGLKGEGRIEVVEGLNPGEQVVAGTAVSPGDRVRALATAKNGVA
jgi:HlyD family secretion protein